MVAKGGTAVLYKAIQTSLDRTVAIKKLHQHLTDDENFTRRFILEAKAAASLDHENIVHVIDFGKSDDDYQIVMEYVEGRSLSDILREKKRLNPVVALAITHQICLGLEHAHAKGIVHRDIKPGNILIARHGRVKITDFGLAKLSQATTQQTAADSLLGTPLYMSPEQAYGESVDARSDLFSLGTLLYELLTGTQPFFSENCMGVINNIINCSVTPPSKLVEEAGGDVERIVMKAMSKDRDTRFQSAEAFRKAIEKCLGIVRLKEAEEQLPALLNDNSQTVILTDTPLSTNRSDGSGRRRMLIVLTGIILAALAAGAVVHYDMIRDSFQHLIGVPGSPDPAIAQIDTGNLIDARTSFPAADFAGDSAAYAPGTVQGPDTMAATGTTVLPDTAADSIAAATGRPDPAVTAAPAPQPAASEPQQETKTVAQTGWLSVSVDPWAAVYIDGHYRSDSPPANNIPLPAGIHSLECRNPQHETYREEIHITAGELSRRSVTLKKLRGHIQLFTEPGAEFYLDGKLYGITPIMKVIDVDAGQHQLTIKKQGYNTWSTEVSVEADKTIPLRIRLSPQF